MRGKAGYVLAAVALAVCLLLVGSRGVLLVREGTPVTIGLGLSALVLPLIGAWFLWRTTRFALRASRLAHLLEQEGGLPVDELRRTPSGRIDRESADAVFRRRRRETEQDPADWRRWFRLAVAYRDCGDTPRARRAMQRAITLERAQPTRAVSGALEPPRHLAEPASRRAATDTVRRITG